MRRSPSRRRWVGLVILSLAGQIACAREAPSAEVTSEEVNQAIRAGIRFLEERQRADGSWPDQGGNALTGTTSLVTLALLTAGEKPDSVVIRNALAFLRNFGPQQLDSTYAISLQTMVFAAVDPERDRTRLVANVDWLERAQHKDARSESWRNWTYSAQRAQRGDNSNTQYALLGLECRQRSRHCRAAGGMAVRTSVF